MIHFDAKHQKSEAKTKLSEKNILEFRFALFRFEAKITKSKRSEKFEAKKEKWSFVVKYWNTCETDPNSLYFAYKREKKFNWNGRTLRCTLYWARLYPLSCAAPYWAKVHPA